MLGLNNNITNPNFKHKSGGKLFNPPPYSVNQFITDLNKEEEKRLNGGFLSKTIGSPTAYFGGLGIILLGELACFAKILSKKKSDFPTPELKKAFKNKVSNNFGHVTYSSKNKKVATVNEDGEIKITGIGSTKIYAKCGLGTTSMTLNVIPNKATISKITKKSANSMSVYIKRDKTVTGYQIIYSKDPKFKKGNKVLTVKNNTKTINTIKNLSKKSKYYVKVRNYKTVNKKNYYGNWSNVKSIKL